MNNAEVEEFRFFTSVEVPIQQCTDIILQIQLLYLKSSKNIEVLSAKCIKSKSTLGGGTTEI